MLNMKNYSSTSVHTEVTVEMPRLGWKSNPLKKWVIYFGNTYTDSFLYQSTG